MDTTTTSNINQDNHHLVNNVTDQLPGTVFRCRNNQNWTMLYLSSASKIITGYPPEELIDDASISYASLIVEEDRERIWQEVQTAIQQKKHFECIYRINTKKGDIKWVWEKGFAEPAEEKDNQIIEGIIIDINEKKQTEIALDKSEKRFRNIVDGSLEGILIHRDWRPLFINKSLLKILGYDSDEEILTLNSMSALIAPYERERISGYSEARLNGEKAPRNYEVEALHRDGSFRFLEIESSLMDWDGEQAILSTLIDITERKKALMEAENQRQQLAHINRLNMLGEMSAGIAHELNQPLTAIVSRCAAARNRINSDEPDLDKIKQALKSIEEQAQRSGQIIEHLREMVKTKQSKSKPINIEELIDFCVRFIKTEEQYKDTNLSINIAKNIPFVLGDPIQIQQVILNLIRNSRDAMLGLAPKDRHFTITAIQHDDHAVQVSVSDCGSGISEEEESGLYKSFFTTKDNGMGMGLSICRTIINAHNGRIWFSRNSNQGVTFRFTLPIFSKQRGNHD